METVRVHWENAFPCSINSEWLDTYRFEKMNFSLARAGLDAHFAEEVEKERSPQYS